jgi:hypothetical protein
MNRSPPVDGASSTVTAAVPETPSTVAVMVADPSATAVARPELLTVATLWADDRQENVLPEIVAPSASRAVAVNCCVPPAAASSAVAGVIVTDATVGSGSGSGSGSGPVPSSLPHAHHAALQMKRTVSARAERFGLDMGTT